MLPRFLPRAALLAGVVLAVAGCGGGGDQSLTGTVTFDGKPIKKGFIAFEPDTAKGNTGRGGGALIVDGAYATPRGKGLGGASGAYIVKITGYDGVPTTVSGEELLDGKPLFPTYQTTADLPAGTATKNFDVPLKATTPPKPPPTTKDGL